MKIKHRGGLGTATLLGKASFNAGVSPLLIVAPPGFFVNLKPLNVPYVSSS